MSGELSVQNRQRTRAVDLRLLRRITNTVLIELLAVEKFELGIHLVATPEMTQLNEAFLHHSGSTDVITFDHSFGVPPSGGSGASSRLQPGSQGLHGEIFICVDEAVAQSRSFHTTWQSELVRYLVHGLLHLRGHDDAQPAARRRMKRAEQRLLGELARRFPLSKLSRKPKVAA